MYAAANALQFLASRESWCKTSATRTGGAEFASAVDAAQLTGQEREEAYLDHLRSKYGAHFRVESIPRDPDVLEKVGGTMSGDDVIISPVMVSKMAQDPEKAAEIEGTIDNCFARVPKDKAHFAAIGLTFEPCGVVVHDDGTVTYICGGGDTPERVAKVNAINAARDARRAEQRRIYIERSTQAALERREMFAERAEAQTAQMHALIHTRVQSAVSAQNISAAAQNGAAGSMFI